VPLAVAAKHVDPNLLGQDTLDNALSKAVAEGFIENKLQALERPEVDVKKFVPGKELEFTAEADVLPEVKLGDYKKLKATKETVAVTKADVDEVIERIQKGFAEKKETKDAAKMGDEVVIDFVGKKDDVAFDGGTGTDYPLTLGSNSFIPGFEEALVGKKEGDTLDVPLTFPAEYHAKDLAGQEVVFSTTIKKVNQVVLPELTDELAAKAGPFTSIDDLQADIKSEIAAQKDREAVDKLQDALVKQLVEKSTVAVPNVLIEDQIRSIEQDMTQNLMYQGMSIEQYFESKGFADRDAWVEGEAKEAAENRIKAGLVLAELSKTEKIEASADELAERINVFKQQYANNPDMAKRFDEPEIQREIANRLITEKAVSRLVELNTTK
jgi:trigger factor